MARTILVIDDENNMRWVLDKALRKAGYEVVTASRGDEGLRQFARHSIDLVLLDLKMPGMDGLTTLRELRQRNKTTPVFLLTAYATIPTAVEALKVGATDYVRKPFDLEDLQTRISYALHSTYQGVSDSGRIATENQEALIGISPATNQLRNTVAAATQNDYPVLIFGETGTGRRFVANWLHHQSAYSTPSNQVVIDCSALPTAILERELGRLVSAESVPNEPSNHLERWEQSLSGTLVLANIEAMPEEWIEELVENVKPYLRTGLRPHGLRLILTALRSHGEINVDSTAHLESNHAFSKFPHAITIEVPPLRNRSEDIPILVALFTPDSIWEDKARRALLEYKWPENIAELKRTLYYAETVANGSPIGFNHLPPTLHPADDSTSESPKSSEIKLPSEGINLEEVEQILITQALERTNGNKAKAARILGISRSTLLYRLEKYGLTSVSG